MLKDVAQLPFEQQKILANIFSIRLNNVSNEKVGKIFKWNEILFVIYNKNREKNEQVDFRC